jgi:hypothetical protein
VATVAWTRALIVGLGCAKAPKAGPAAGTAARQTPGWIPRHRRNQGCAGSQAVAGVRPPAPARAAMPGLAAILAAVLPGLARVASVASCRAGTPAASVTAAWGVTVAWTPAAIATWAEDGTRAWTPPAWVCVPTRGAPAPGR